jgi:hypothetical protein
VRTKQLHETPFASLVRRVLNALHGRMPITVCSECVQTTDEVLHAGGDFSICDRCNKSITSKTGVAVRSKVFE